MTSDRDPLELMPQFLDPEPDPVVMDATIAQSRDAFANRQVRLQQSQPASFWDWARRSANWLAPVGAVAVAFFVVILVVPSLTPTAPPRTADRDQVAEAPVETPSTGDTPTLSRGDQASPSQSPDSGTRMGMQPSPTADPTETLPLPQTVSSFAGDGIRIGTRRDAQALEIFLPDISGDQTIDAQSIMPGEEIGLAAAFAQPDSDLIAIQFQVNDMRFWRIYALANGTYRRDPQRSKLVSDAGDRADVERRLAAN